MNITTLRKRDGRLVPFDRNKITGAIIKAFNATYRPGGEAEAARLTDEVCSILDGNTCGNRSTSFADQLCHALREAKSAE